MCPRVFRVKTNKQKKTKPFTPTLLQSLSSMSQISESLLGISVTWSCKVIHSVLEVRKRGVISDVPGIPNASPNPADFISYIPFRCTHFSPVHPGLCQLSFLDIAISSYSLSAVTGTLPHPQPILHTATRAIFSKYKCDVTCTTAKTNDKKRKQKLTYFIFPDKRLKLSVCLKSSRSIFTEGSEQSYLPPPAVLID